MDSFGSADTVTDAEWNKVMGVNLTAPTKMMRAVLVHMKEAKSGAIVNVSSKAGMSGAAAGIAYTASKHGLVGRSVDLGPL
jgi:NAD(P)-dependent dehydrogenase (short-subunit alcohol dehydrogenase family)